MSDIQPSNNPSRPVMWLSVFLAVFAALAYVLIALRVLPVGDLKVAQDGGVITYVAAGCYLLGGLLILTRLKWLWVIGILINALVVVFFFRMYQSKPEVVFSAGGMATKAAQLLLEVTLTYLLVSSWVKKTQKAS